MKREEVLTLWRRAVNAIAVDSKEPHAELLLFAGLVAAHERDRMTVNSIHTCHAECDKPGCVAMREAVKAEREACADICDQHATVEGIAQKCAAAIRARGET